MTQPPTDYRALLAALPARQVAPLPPAQPQLLPPRRASAKPWQFSLRSLLIGVALMSGFSAVLLTIGAAAAAVVIWLLLLIAAHVMANAWGTRTSRPGAARFDEPMPPPPDAAQVARHAAPRSRLGGEMPLSAALPVLAAFGALAGGSFGTWVLIAAYGDRQAWFGIAFGGAAAAVLGGFLGFLSGSFCEVGLRSLREATRASGAPVPRGLARPDSPPKS